MLPKFRPAIAPSRLYLLLLLFTLFAFFTPSASATLAGVGGYDLRSTSDLALAFDYDGTGKLDHILFYRPGTGIVYIVANNAGVYTAVFASSTGIGGCDLTASSDRIIAFDYSGAGKPDHLVCYRPGTGMVQIVANNSGTFSSVVTSTAGLGGYDLKSVRDKIIAFDYDGSGLYDHLVLYRPGSGIVYILSNAAGVFTPVYASAQGIGGYDLLSRSDQLVAFDYYGIGTADHLIAYRPGPGIAYILENNNTGDFTPVFTSSAGIGGYDLRSTRDRLLAFDFDGFGNQDHLVAYRPGTGIVYVLESAYFAYSPEVASSEGIGGDDLKSPLDMAFTFDYSSDQHEDYLALYRPGSGIFFVEQNTAGVFSPLFRHHERNDY